MNILYALRDNKWPSTTEYTSSFPLFYYFSERKPHNFQQTLRLRLQPGLKASVSGYNRVFSNSCLKMIPHLSSKSRKVATHIKFSHTYFIFTIKLVYTQLHMNPISCSQIRHQKHQLCVVINKNSSVCEMFPPALNSLQEPPNHSRHLFHFGMLFLPVERASSAHLPVFYHTSNIL